ncbi:facilitated trehalose transporter Tret1-2 homolog [Anthonomus grandis grandis]|uniref:facilitated trehalose transporter Tret1-2 homolog n=1 Tax=Anthonomus grandis grandis TaxID=2921223 RepID=UPI002166BB88|nr:facilitated trehalose transporter Tret1-2 homolog [Anthonomus grandis grandis]
MAQDTSSASSIFVLRARQALIALGPILITISLGLAEGYSAILLPQLENDPAWNVDTNMASWIASIATLPMSIGCVLGGWLMETIGRKLLHLATCLPNIIGWLLIAFCENNMELLLLGRFITGMCVGVLSPVLIIYVAETSDPVFRGFLLPSVSLALNFGIAISHIMGTYLDWDMVAWLACFYPTGCFLIMVFMPESPTYLIKKGRVEKAQEEFFWFRGDTLNSRQELDTIINNQQQQLTLTIKEQLKIVFEPEFYKPLLILLIFFSTMQWAGNNPVAFYTINILQEVLKGSIVDAYTSMLIMDGVRICASILGCFGQRFLKRRLLMVLSCLGTIISLIILSIYLYAIDHYNFKQDLSLIPVISLVSYVLFINVGLLPLPYSMSGELFGQRCRGLGSGIVTLFNMILMFVVVKITPWMFDTWKSYGTFALFAISCLVGMTVLVVVLPETKDKPLHVIEEDFRRKKVTVPPRI